MTKVVAKVRCLLEKDTNCLCGLAAHSKVMSVVRLH